jgi:ribosomal protein S18 acetylase RimI-like enzyme
MGQASGVTIRHPRNDDYDKIIRVVDDWWGGRAMAAMLPRLFFTHFRPMTFVAHQNETIVGFVTGFVSAADPDRAYIHFVGVDPNARASGIGRQLYERFFDAARAAGSRQVSCVTSPSNHQSIAFHRRLGFEPVDSPATRDGIPYFPAYDGPGEDRVLFTRAL